MIIISSKGLNSSTWPIDGTLKGTPTPSQNEHGCKFNEVVLHILQSSTIGASPSDGLVSYTGHLLGWS